MDFSSYCIIFQELSEINLILKQILEREKK